MANSTATRMHRTFESECFKFKAISQSWGKELSFSRFISFFNRNGTVALYNSINGGILYYPNELFEPFRAIIEKKSAASPQQIALSVKPDKMSVAGTAFALNEMLEYSFLIPSDFNEDETIEKLRAAFSRPTRFENFTVYITSGCNLHCDYCQLHTQPGKSSTGTVDMESFKQAFHTFMTPQSHSRGYRRKIQLFGGEPLVEWNILTKMVEYVKHCESIKKYGEEQVDICINTNGVLLTDEKLEYMKKNNIYLSVSLDGGKEVHDQHRKDWSGHGTYQKVIDNIQKAKKKGLDVMILSVLGAHNLLALPQFVKYLHDSCNISNVTLNPIFGDDNIQEKFSVMDYKKQLISIIDKLLGIDGVIVRPFYDQWCEFSSGKAMLASQECLLGTRLVLFPGGRVAPCVDYAFSEKAANISSFDSLLPTTAWSDIGSKWSLYDPKCYSSCSLIGFCDGGCAVNAQLADKDRGRPICHLSWAVLECFIWRLHKILDKE